MRRPLRPGSARVAVRLGAAAGTLLLAACASGGAAAGPVATKPEYKVTVAGDSISVGLGVALRTTAPSDVVVKVIGEDGTGLARPDRFDWPARLRTLARDFPPRVLVFSLASNDAQDLRDAAGSVTVPFTDTSRWDEEYSRRLAEAFDAFAGTATTVVWVGHVRTTDDRIGLVNRRVQRLAADVAAERDHVVVSDLGDLLGTGEEVATRCLLPDGVHLTAGCLDEAATRIDALLPGRG